MFVLMRFVLAAKYCLAGCTINLHSFIHSFIHSYSVTLGFTIISILLYFLQGVFNVNLANYKAVSVKNLTNQNRSRKHEQK